MPSFDEVKVSSRRRRPLMRFYNSYGQLRLMPAPRVAKGEKGVQLTEANLSKDQLVAYQKLRQWALEPDDRPVLVMGGYAGTGKTTLLSLLAGELIDEELTIAFCAYTGKAANVLRQKLTVAGVRIGTDAYCGTIHGLIYEGIINEKTGAIIGWTLREELPYDMIIVDEASMLDDELFGHLQSYGIRILAVGDHGQLPPIGKNKINLMENPDIRLENIHRQAAGNPIILLSAEIRAGINPVDFKPSDDRVQIWSARSLNNVLATEYGNQKPDLEKAVLCYFNKTRALTNQKVRAMMGRESAEPAKDDLVICLKNTRFKALSVYNGMRGSISRIDPGDEMTWDAQIDFDEDRLELEASISQQQFNRDSTIRSFNDVGVEQWSDVGMLFDFGYCLTVHKSQGSQFKTAIVIVQKSSYDSEDDHRRWLYTAVTRASDRLILLV